MTGNYSFALVDAFSSTPLQGNPCAVVLGAEQLTAEKMLQIAKEMNQSETAFLSKSETAHLKARYFTPEREIPLAGHPTIACIHTAIQSGLIELSSSITRISLELNDGPIQVDIEETEHGRLIRMFQRKPEFLDIHDPEILPSLFHLDSSDLLKGAVIQTVSTGTRQLMVPLKNKDCLRKIKMNTEKYRDYRSKMGFFSPHFFVLGGLSSHLDPKQSTFARHLGTPPDTLEDAFTGSATGGMAAYLWKYGFLEKSTLIAEQGHWMGRPGQAWVEVLGERNAPSGVSVAGYAVTTVKGTLTC